MGLSTVMEVTVRDMDVTVEHTGMCLLRVTGMTVFKNGLFHTTLLCLLSCGSGAQVGFLLL